MSLKLEAKLKLLKEKPSANLGDDAQFEKDSSAWD
jgi:hypothetical protein